MTEEEKIQLLDQAALEARVIAQDYVDASLDPTRLLLELLKKNGVLSQNEIDGLSERLEAHLSHIDPDRPISRQAYRNAITTLLRGV